MISTTDVREAFVAWAARTRGWSRAYAVEQFDAWLDERRAVASSLIICP